MYEALVGSSRSTRERELDNYRSKQLIIYFQIIWRGCTSIGRIFECTEFDPQHHIKPGMVTDMYNYSTQEVDAGRSEAQAHTQLQEFKSIQGQ